MATNTYVPLDTYTVTGSSTSAVTFSSISQSYTDLRVVISGLTSATGYSFTLGVGNGSIDTGSNYSQTLISGSGTVAQSARYSSSTNTSMYLGGWVSGYNASYYSTVTIDLLSYSSSTIYKTAIWRAAASTRNAEAGEILWRGSTGSAVNQPINTLSINAQAGSSIAVGTKVSLYGIKAWEAEATPKATGGYVYSDSTYWYHAFPFSGTFTPLTSLSADILQIAGGGGGAGPYYAGGGGAGGLLYYTGQSLTTTAYTVTVGAGGAGTIGSLGTQGGNSQFASLTASVGGGYGAIALGSSNPTAGGPGGSGGGGGADGNGGGSAGGGAGTSGQGQNGGSSISPGGANSAGGGGGGFSAVGSNATSNNGGLGGNGTNTYASWAAVTATGANGGYYAGGGGGGAGNTAGGLGGTAGLGGGGKGGDAQISPTGPGYGIASTGGGGGGATGNTKGGSGGSGIVIVRYAK